MEDARRDSQLEELMAELSWLKRLASALVRDESDAKDLVQETWLVATDHTGIVTDVTGGAIEGARIDAARLQLDTKAGRAVAVAFSDRAGRYKLAVGGGAIFVAASHPEYAPRARYVDLGSSGAAANFALVPGGVIEGVVRDAQTKQPVAGAAVRAMNDSSAVELAEGNEVTP